MGMLVVDNLNFQRDQRSVLSDVSFSAAAGELLLVRGANGAGKSTLLRVLAGVLQGAGDIDSPYPRLRGKYPAQPGVGGINKFYLGHKLALHPKLTVTQNLLTSTTASQAEILNALDYFQLSSQRNTAVSNLSAGQQQRVALSRLILSSAELWLLDEPFTNLDPNGEQLLITLIQQHVDQVGTAIVTSHRQHQWGSILVKTLELNEAAPC